MEWRLSTVGAGRAWPATDQPLPRARDYKLPHTDSGQNSLEYWDYTVELEMLKGPEDLQLAAELGKTLLERNRELEGTIKNQQTTLEDQLQEIEYLSKQTAALREVNDSRLRIYEQLEISIQELEKNNQRLAAEGAADKRKIKSLSDNLESLEARCDELQRSLDEARAGAQQQRGRNKRRSVVLEEQNFRRSQSCENTTQTSEEHAAEETEARARLEELQDKLREMQEDAAAQARQREELEIQLACVSQENSVLRDQLAVLHEKEVTLRTFDEELASLDDSSSSRLCRKCMGQVDELASNPTLYDLTDSIEDTDASIESIHGECALIKLKNGGYAWGSQESLASIGQVISRVGSGGTSPGTEASDAPHNSLLSELDTSYRILIEKYEALLEAREQQQQQHQQQQETRVREEELVDPGVDELSGPMSLMMTQHDTIVAPKCQRCHTCTCDMKPSVGRPKSNLEEFSEVETSSSGFSDGESRLSNKSTQTGDDLLQREILEDLTPTPSVASKCLDFSSPVNPCDKRFQAAPEYKKLFQEIFSVLKKTVDEKEPKTQSPKASDMSQDHENVLDNTLVYSGDNEGSDEVNGNETAVTNEGNIDEPEVVQLRENLGSKPKPNEKPTGGISSDPSPQLPDRAAGITASADSHGEPTQDNSTVLPGQNSRHTKLLRPDSLDLGSSSSSRPSSRQRRRRRQHRLRLDSLRSDQQPQQQPQPPQHSDGVQGQHQHNHRHHRRDREGHHPRHQSEDFPTLHMEGEEANKTRVIYNSSRTRCEHHRSRKHRDRSNNSHVQRSQPEGVDHRHTTTDTEPKNKPTQAKINFPSVEVAKLRKLEMTYAEALKNSMNRSQYNRRY